MPPGSPAGAAAEGARGLRSAARPRLRAVPRPGGGGEQRAVGAVSGKERRKVRRRREEEFT